MTAKGRPRTKRPISLAGVGLTSVHVSAISDRTGARQPKAQQGEFCQAMEAERYEPRPGAETTKQEKGNRA
jgi:hypothetical protein